MIHAHSLGRAARYFPERPALAAAKTRTTFQELHDRVGCIAAALDRHGFKAGDRLALLLPNEPDYIELVYACAWLGVIAVPLNTRLSVKEIDVILSDANPRGLIRHSSLPVPTAQVPWQVVLDREPLDRRSDSVPDPIYDLNAILALIYTSGTTGRPKGVEMRHANILENVYHTNFWFPLEEGAMHLHAAPIFHIADFPFMFAAPAFGACQVTIPKFNPQTFCETVQRERVTHTVLVPTMINMLTQFPELQKYDLSTLDIWDTADLRWLLNLSIGRDRFCRMLNSFRSTDSAKPVFSLACSITNTPRTSSLLAVGLASESTCALSIQQERKLKLEKLAN